MAFPTLTPASSGELYAAYGESAALAVAGSTTGFTYDITTNTNDFAFNPSVSSSVSPTGSMSPASTYETAGALISASATSNYAWNPYGELCNVSVSGATTCGATPAIGTAYA